VPGSSGGGGGGEKLEGEKGKEAEGGVRGAQSVRLNGGKSEGRRA